MSDPDTNPSTPPPLWTNDRGYFYSDFLKFSLGNGPKFRAFTLPFCYLSQKLAYSIAVVPDAAAWAKRHDEIMKWRNILAVVAGALMGSSIYALDIIPWPWHSYVRDHFDHARGIWDIVALGSGLSGLFISGCSLLLDHDAYLCFKKMVEAYNNSIATSPKPDCELPHAQT